MVAHTALLAGVRISLLLLGLLSSAIGNAGTDKKSSVASVVAQTIRPLMEQYGIPGMAVGVVLDGESYVSEYGVASKATGDPVTAQTVFEIGSISKTFTATLASYAQEAGHLSLSDKASSYLPILKGSAFDDVSLLNLGTHTAGGLPLQVPDDIKDNDHLMRYFQTWKPSYAPGAYRTYANPSIGMLGMIAAKSLKEDFKVVMADKIFAGLHLKSTFLDVPVTHTKNYAQGYTKTNEPIRMAPGILALEAYGIRTTASDLVLFLKANMHLLDIDEKLQRAITKTHAGYYKINTMTQGLIWEQYPYPVQLEDLLAGNSPKVIFEANPATKIDPPTEPRGDVLINKTGSTNGFAAYVAFVPQERVGIILLANKSYPIAARVKAAHEILTRLDRLNDSKPKRSEGRRIAGSLRVPFDGDKGRN